VIEVLAAPPFLMVQDLGREQFRAQGVPVSGAMDPWALSTANVLVGNPPEAAAFEWGLGAGTVRWHRAGFFALAGAPVEATLDGAPAAMHTTYRVQPGSTLTVHRFPSGRFAYLATDGGLDVPLVLGSRATYLPGHFGGFAGRLLRSNDQIALAAPVGRAPAAGFVVPAPLEPRYDSAECRVIPGPHASLFGSAGWDQLTSASFRIDAGSDRTGYRLTGHVLEHRVDTALASAPLCAGAIQVPAGGRPIVLMADAPTVGGYPVIAVVGSVDLPLIAQRQLGEDIRFRSSTVPELQRALRTRAVTIHTLIHLVAKGAKR
jgi:biotin-dependent carboxylase-like uncharacterized protein